MSRADIAFFPTSHYGADEPPHLLVPGEGTSCRPLLPKIIRAAATSASRRMTLTVQAAALLPPRDRTGLTMLTAMAAIFIVLSIGILIAHALDAFRSR